MKKALLVFFVLLSIMPRGALAQHFDYHLEETPAVGWNGVYLYDARLLAMGGISFTASPPFSAVINPALTAADTKLSAGGTFQKIEFEAFQYWGLNEGVAIMPEPPDQEHSSFSSFSGTFKRKGLRFSAGWYLSNYLQFPSFENIHRYEYDQFYSYSGIFSGSEHTYFAAAALKLSEAVDIGVKLAYTRGERTVETSDIDSFYHGVNGTWVKKTIRVQQEENHRSTIWAPSIGTTVKISSNWTLGCALTYPLTGKVDRTVLRFFENGVDNIYISQQQDGRDKFHRPAILYLGASLRLPAGRDESAGSGFILAAETQVSFWSGYKYIFFEEELPRDMRNTASLALGAEYGSKSGGLEYFLRLGFRLDPQPLTEPGVTLNVWSGGIGVRYGAAAVDTGISYYSGSTGGVEQNHFIINTTISINLGKN
jgi:opacity protein-like surface antigen